MNRSTPGLPVHHNSRSPPKPMSFQSVMPSNHLILCRPLLLLPSIFPSIRVFSNESALCIRWPKDWSCSFSISPSSEHLGLISFRTDWLDLLAVKGSLKSCRGQTTWKLSEATFKRDFQGKGLTYLHFHQMMRTGPEFQEEMSLKNKNI